MGCQSAQLIPCPSPELTLFSKMMLQSSVGGRGGRGEGTATNSFPRRTVFRHVHAVWKKGGLAKKLDTRKTIPDSKLELPQPTVPNFSTFHLYKSKPFFKLNLTFYFCTEGKQREKSRAGWKVGRNSVFPPPLHTSLTPKLIPEGTPITPGVLRSSLKTRALIQMFLGKSCTNVPNHALEMLHHIPFYNDHYLILICNCKEKLNS